jgi:hypothetical protein
MTAVSLGAGGLEDLKRLMSEKKGEVDQYDSVPGAPNEYMYLKQAEHLLRIAAYPAAAKYTQKALEMNPESTVSSLIYFYIYICIYIYIYIYLHISTFVRKTVLPTSCQEMY